MALISIFMPVQSSGLTCTLLDCHSAVTPAATQNCKFSNNTCKCMCTCTCVRTIQKMFDYITLSAWV